LVQIGVGLEAWVTPMIEAAKNPRLTVVTTAQGIPLLREQEPVEQNGEHPPHAFGNPHVWLDPENAKTMIRTMTDALIRVAPAHRADFLINQARYVNEITTVETDIQAQVKPLRDRRIVTHHAAWPYFARRFGFQIEGVIIEQPGGEVSAKNLAALTTLIRQKKIRVIATEPQLNTAVAQTLAQETGARLVTITRLPGALPGTETYLLMLRYDAEQLIRALRAP
jgi:ABC-type Zn uptake system ZnuABC Zn-binding protein ZnuA